MRLSLIALAAASCATGFALFDDDRAPGRLYV